MVNNKMLKTMSLPQQYFIQAPKRRHTNLDRDTHTHARVSMLAQLENDAVSYLSKTPPPLTEFVKIGYKN